MIKRIIGKIQQAISKNSLALRILIKAKSQAECIIGYSLAKTSESSKNGEENLLKKIGPEIKTFFDIGANKGAWTQSLLKNVEGRPKGYLFEPSGKNIKKLQRIFSKQNSITLIQKAVGNAIGQMEFHEDEENDEHSRLVSIPRSLRKKNLVRVSTVDAEIRSFKIKNLSFLKIDTEGFDSFVLMGAQKSLRDGIIENLQFEYNSMWKESGSTLTFTVNMLSAYGYKTFLVLSDRLVEVKNPSEIEVFKYSNFFATRKKPNQYASLLKPGL